MKSKKTMYFTKIIAVLLAVMLLPMSESFADDTSSVAQTAVTLFQVGNLSPQVETDLDYTDWWLSEWDDNYYIFLPATADRSDLTITYEADGLPLYLNGTEIISGQKTDLLSTADEFTVTVGENFLIGTLQIMQSNLGCIYLTTSSGGLDALDNNKNLVETASAVMLDADGSVEYTGDFEKLTSHGNSSWDYSAKKPYNFKLPAKANLYGMGKAKKWVLLGNYLDHSMLRNYVSFEMSRAGGMEYVMDSVFIDLYADGSYRGTYQLCERVQVQKYRVNITDLGEETEDVNLMELSSYTRKSVNAELDEYAVNSYKYYDIPNNPDDITGGYLLEFQMSNRYASKAKSGFITTRGQAIEVKTPEYASQAQIEYIREFVQDLEDAIYSDTGYNSKGKHYSEYVDVDSMIISYLMKEISMDTDGTIGSVFLWKDSDANGDGKLHFSPAWDFDLAYNNFSISHRNADDDVGYSYKIENLFAYSFPISGYGTYEGTVGISWIGTLYKRGDIVQRVAEIYFDNFYDYLCELSDTEQEGGALITQMGETIAPSAEMNNARWHMYGGREYRVFGYEQGNNFTECVDFLRDFIDKRKDYLTSLWLPLVDEDAEYLVKGDVNVDGVFNQKDIIMMQKYLLKQGGLTLWTAGDYNRDGKINIYDLCLMKHELLE